MQYNDFPRMENVSLLEATDVDMSQLFSFFFFSYLCSLCFQYKMEAIIFYVKRRNEIPL